MTSTPLLWAALTTARMTAFNPGASPPPVSTPILLILGMKWMRRRVDAHQIEYSPSTRKHFRARCQGDKNEGRVRRVAGPPERALDRKPARWDDDHMRQRQA